MDIIAIEENIEKRLSRARIGNHLARKENVGRIHWSAALLFVRHPLEQEDQAIHGPTTTKKTISLQGEDKIVIVEREGKVLELAEEVGV